MRKIHPQFDNVGRFSEGLAAVELNKKYGFIDRTGSIVIPFHFDYAYSFSEGLAQVTQAEKCGFINKTGHLVIPYQFNFPTNPFSGGLASVKVNTKKDYIWIYIDREGNQYWEEGEDDQDDEIPY
jgi:hypothetical protein